jgi:hypothetical protein
MALSHVRILLNVGKVRKSGPPTADRQDKRRKVRRGRSCDIPEVGRLATMALEQDAKALPTCARPERFERPTPRFVV